MLALLQFCTRDFWTFIASVFLICAPPAVAAEATTKLIMFLVAIAQKSKG